VKQNAPCVGVMELDIYWETDTEFRAAETPSSGDESGILKSFPPATLNVCLDRVNEHSTGDLTEAEGPYLIEIVDRAAVVWSISNSSPRSVFLLD
jgi:hypothetical protein